MFKNFINLNLRDSSVKKFSYGYILNVRTEIKQASVSLRIKDIITLVQLGYASKK